MDEKDVTILFAISDLETGSPDKIADETGIPKSTVHYRIQKLRDEGIIKNDLYDFDMEKIGLDVTIISEVIATYDEEYHRRVGTKLGAVEGVKQVFFTMGDVDFVVISQVTDRDMVEQLFGAFEAIDEVQRTMSKFVISSVKDDYNSLSGYAVETILDA